MPSKRGGKPFPCLRSLPHALKNESHHLADVVLMLKAENVTTVTFPAHGLVLEARSSLFCQLLFRARGDHVHCAECFLTRCKYILVLEHSFPVDSSSFSAFLELLYDGKVSTGKRAVSSTISSLCDYYQVTLASAAASAGTDITALATKQSTECRDGSSQTDSRPMGVRSSTTQANALPGDVEPTASNNNNSRKNDNNNNATDGAYMTKVDNARQRDANTASFHSADDDASSLTLVSTLDPEEFSEGKSDAIVAQSEAAPKEVPVKSSLIDAFRGPSSYRESNSTDAVMAGSRVSSPSLSPSTTSLSASPVPESDVDEEKGDRSSGASTTSPTTLVLRLVPSRAEDGSGEPSPNITEYALSYILNGALGANAVTPRRIYRGPGDDVDDDDDVSAQPLLVRLATEEAKKIISGRVQLTHGPSKLVFEPDEGEKVWGLKYKWKKRSEVAVEDAEREIDDYLQSLDGVMAIDKNEPASNITGVVYFYTKSDLSRFLASRKDVENGIVQYKVKGNDRKGFHVRKFWLTKDRLLPNGLLVDKLTDVLSDHFIKKITKPIFSVYVDPESQDHGEIAFDGEVGAVAFDARKQIEFEIGGVEISLKYDKHLIAVEADLRFRADTWVYTELRRAYRSIGTQTGNFDTNPGRRNARRITKVTAYFCDNGRFDRNHRFLTDGFVNIPDPSGRREQVPIRVLKSYQVPPTACSSFNPTPSSSATNVSCSSAQSRY